MTNIDDIDDYILKKYNGLIKLHNKLYVEVDNCMLAYKYIVLYVIVHLVMVRLKKNQCCYLFNLFIIIVGRRH